MSEIRYRRIFKGGIEIETIPYEVSDEELDAELEAEARELAIKEITAKKKEELKENKKDK